MSTDNAMRTELPSDKPRGSMLERGLYKALAEAAVEAMINSQSAVERLVGSWEILPPAKLGELLASIDPDSLDDDDAIEFLKASARHRAWTDSLQSAALNRFAKLRPQLDGPGQEGISKFAAGEIAAALAMPNQSARKALKEAKFIHDFLPGTADAMEAGRLDQQRATVIARAATSLPDAVLSDFEAAVLPKAPSLTRGRLAKFAEKHRDALHPEPLEIRFHRAAAEREVVFLPQPDGMADCYAKIPAHSAAMIQDRVEAGARALQGPEESRTLPQLRADVFCEMLLNPDAAPLEARGQQSASDESVPTGDSGTTKSGSCGTINITGLSVTVSLETLLGLSEAPGDLAGFGPLPPSLARELAGLAKSWLPVLISDDGTFVRAAAKKRVPPKALKRWVQFRDKRCRFPNCDRPAASCETDHTVAWEDGGLSRLLNLASLCKLHHDLKHLAGWKCRQLDGGVLEWVAPTGHRYLDVPEPIGPLDPSARRRRSAKPDDHPFQPGTGQGSRAHDPRHLGSEEPSQPDPQDPFQPANLTALAQLPLLSHEEAHPPPF
ncbi:HNH endonuclease signature motif containing protein [Crystallibacter degradans]|uniref:HNH endonuclease signature motif containing protein n=1 Tax=Crystallibacter degradans TaxID=2726743 RepID=UPI001472969E|nr:HNH endonuclease signature motif containing protein [Arthrobacter sp. SF27]NMR30799.1 DUF222 domain-containing protein [Arthrobacter sp. SF27]